MKQMPVVNRSHDSKSLSVTDGSPSPRLEIRDFRLIVAIVEEGSLTLASNRLHVTQPGLSRHLKALETRLGTKLFTRVGPRLSLAPAGELLLRHARETLERVAQIEDDVRDTGRDVRHVLRVGTQCYTAYHWMPSVLGRYAVQQPRVRVEIAFEVKRRPLQHLMDGLLEVALVSDDWRGRGLATTRLFADEFVAVVSPGHPLASRSFLEPRDFSGSRLLILVPPRDSTVVRQFLEPAHVRPHQTVDVQLVGALTSLVTSQLGVGVLPSWTVAPELRSGKLIAVRLGRKGLRRVWVAATTRALHKAAWVRDFVQLIASSGPAAGLMSLDSASDPGR
jgi:LysR family transcriptional regulator, regulator for metE and metH